jgi:hypothetical protein
VTYIFYKQFRVNVCKCLNGASSDTIPSSVDLSIRAKLFISKDQQLKNGSKFPLKPITLHSRTLIVDLESESTDIYSSFNRQNKQKIKRAEREGYHHEVLLSPNDNEVQTYIDFFQAFASWKGIQMLPEDRFKKAAEAGVISITWMRDDHLNPLCGHAYLHDGNSVIMIHSASHRDGKDSSLRNTIGRANRLLHWKNILFYRDNGIKWYDFSGIFIDPTEQQEKNINEFKRGFGGQEVNELKIFQAHSIKGQLLLLGVRWKWRNKHEYLRALKSKSQTAYE